MSLKTWLNWWRVMKLLFLLWSWQDRGWAGQGKRETFLFEVSLKCLRGCWTSWNMNNIFDSIANILCSTHPWSQLGSWCLCGPFHQFWCDAAWQSWWPRCWSMRTSSDFAKRWPMARTRATCVGLEMDVEHKLHLIYPTSMLSVLLNASNVF